MTNAAALLTVMAIVGASALVLALVALGAAPLTRRQLDAFCLRQAWRPTDAGTPVVARSLAIVRRWRRAAMVVGLAVGLLRSIPDGRLSIELLDMFLGWFVGAAIAEWRISRVVRPSGPRASDLRPRGIATYVSPVARRITALALIALLATALGTFVASVGRPLPREWMIWVAVALVAAVGLALTVRRVIDRPHGYLNPAVRDADDAVRCQSLTVLAGCVVATAGWITCQFLSLTWDGLGPLLVFLGSCLLGCWVATGSRSQRTRLGTPADDRIPTA